MLSVVLVNDNKIAHIALLQYNYINNTIKENINMCEENKSKNTKQKPVKETFGTKPKHTPQPDKKDKKEGE